MAKRKRKTSETESSSRKTHKIAVDVDKAEGPEKEEKDQEGKEKLVPFDFEENVCDVIIIAKDKKVHIPSSFLGLVSNGGLTLVENEFTIDASSDSLIQAFSFYDPKYWEGIEEGKLHVTFFLLLLFIHITFNRLTEQAWPKSQIRK